MVVDYRNKTKGQRGPSYTQGTPVCKTEKTSDDVGVPDSISDCVFIDDLLMKV